MVVFLLLQKLRYSNDKSIIMITTTTTIIIIIIMALFSISTRWLFIC